MESLDAVFATPFPAEHLLDAVECKLFGLGSESYVAGSHEFYLGYAITRRKVLCLDAGHFHPTEVISDKISSVLQYVDRLLLHVSRGIRWDSDHVVTLTEELIAIAQETVRGGFLNRVHFGLDFFDASINRIAAWVIGARALLRAILIALLEPVPLLREAEQQSDYTRRLALQEEFRGLPSAAVWDYHCLRSDVPAGLDWLAAVREYEEQVLSKRHGPPEQTRHEEFARSVCMTWLELKNLSKSYGGVTALRAVSFGLELGEVHALCGENGAGKSTLIKILAGLVQADSGEIVLNGEIQRIPTVQASEQAGIAVMHQESTAFPDLNAVDNIFVGREITRAGGILLDRQAMRNRTRQLLDRLGESFSIDCPVRQLSLAQRQMVALARALSLDCRLLIMDEPTASLSERETARLKSVVHDLRSAGICILYVSHRLDEVFELADRTTVLRDGQLISSRPTSEFTRVTLIRDMVGRELSLDPGSDAGNWIEPNRVPVREPTIEDMWMIPCPRSRFRGCHRQESLKISVFRSHEVKSWDWQVSWVPAVQRLLERSWDWNACETGMISINGNTFSTWSIEKTIASGL